MFIPGALSSAAWYNIGLVVVILSVLVMAVIAYRTWIEANEDLDPVSSTELVSSFEDALAAGELNQEEFERVRKRISDGASVTAGSGPASDNDVGRDQ